MLLTTKGHALSLLSVVTSNSPAQRYFMAPEFKNLKYDLKRSSTPSRPLHLNESPPSDHSPFPLFSLPTLDSLISLNFKSHPPKFLSLSLSLSLSLTLTTATKKLVDENGVHIGDGERNQEPVRVPWPRLQVLFDELFSRSSQIYLQRQQCRRRALQFGGSHHLQLGRRRHRFRRRIFVHAELRLRRGPFLLERSQCAGT